MKLFITMISCDFSANSSICIAKFTSKLLKKFCTLQNTLYYDLLYLCTSAMFTYCSIVSYAFSVPGLIINPFYSFLLAAYVFIHEIYM
uniref:Uncharacterized protein n=1 Tax=Pinctada fucata TaxID=50426 RepID=A0A194AP36_PINFU